MSSIPSVLADQPALRVRYFESECDPGEAGETLSPGMTLPEFFSTFYRPVCLAGAAPRNVGQYDESIGFLPSKSPDLVADGLRGKKKQKKPKGLWRTFTIELVSRRQLAAEPSLEAIDDRLLALFREWLAARPGRSAPRLSANTVRKHLIAVNAVLRRVGPRSRDRNPQGRDLIADPPRAVKPAIVKNKQIKRFTIDEISAWLAVCHLARSPKTPGIEPRQWWQSAIVLAYNTGLRLGELLKAQFDWLVEDEDGQWLELPAWAAKGGQNGRRVYLNSPAKLALRAIAPGTSAERREVLPFRHELGYVQALRRKMLAESSIDPKRHFGFHALRKAFATEMGRLSPSEAAVKMAMGHSGDVTLDFYQHRELMIEAMDKLPQPVWRPDRDGDQMLMF